MLLAQFVHLALARELTRKTGRLVREQEHLGKRCGVRVNKHAARVIDRDEDRAPDLIREPLQLFENPLIAETIRHRSPPAAVARRGCWRPALAAHAMNRNRQAPGAACDAERAMVEKAGTEAEDDDGSGAVQRRGADATRASCSRSRTAR